MGCTNSQVNRNRQMSPVVNNNNNNNNQKDDSGEDKDGGDNDGGDNDGEDNDGECDSDFVFFYEMESDSDEVGQGQSKCFNTILHLQNVKSPLYTKTSGKIQLQLHFCENYSIILCLSITSNVNKIIIQG